MSHHFDTTIAREDPRLNITDFYLFRGGPGKTVMALAVNPNAGVKAPDTFHEEGLYAFRFDVNGDAREEVTFKIRFGKVDHSSSDQHVQDVEVLRAVGADASEGAGGEVIARGTTGDVISAASDVKVFAGIAPELFAANRSGLHAFHDAYVQGRFAPESFRNGENYFGNRNVTAIVLEVPSDLIGNAGDPVRAWATVSLHGHAPEVQVARWGLPLMTHIFITGPEEKDAYNETVPSMETPRFSQIVTENVRKVCDLAASTENSVAYAERVVARLFPSTLPYVLGSEASFGFAGFNGRTLTDNVMNVMLSLQTNTPIDNGVAVDRDGIINEFPYYGSPNAHPATD
ncbi:DUF4331 family protein [Streptomyces sp. NBC_01497]|uniref:DUF4331 family protein n=1 Tax=Streptomyces sp. NBC_01497 TaxID=2903885 RepID=UPI002E37420F|nr:DUF4331 family protein [Streptomyces sp. NBC_01497]